MLSCVVGGIGFALHPRRHMTAARIKTIATRHRIQFVARLYGRSFFSLVIVDSLLMKVSVSLLQPPVHDNIIGVKVDCSIILLSECGLHIYAFIVFMLIITTVDVHFHI